MNSIQSNVIITGARARNHGELSLTIVTPELSPEEMTVFFMLKDINLTATFTPIDETPKEAMVIDNDIDQKSASERLRAIIYVWWKNEQKTRVYKIEETLEPFEEFYKRKMEKIIDTIKSKLPPLE